MKGQKQKIKEVYGVGCKQLPLPNGKKRRHTMTRAFHDQTHMGEGGGAVRESVGKVGGAAS